MYERFSQGITVLRGNVNRTDEWCTDSACVFVYRGQSGSIIKAMFFEMDPPDHTPLGRLLRVAKRQWQERFR
jgi:hypothetical protein